jgi:hypothetical protein
MVNLTQISLESYAHYLDDSKLGAEINIILSNDGDFLREEIYRCVNLWDLNGTLDLFARNGIKYDIHHHNLICSSTGLISVFGDFEGNE